MSVLVHGAAEKFISRNSGLEIARVIAQGNGAAACELWEQPLRPGDVIPMHYHLVEETVTFMQGRISVILDGTEHRIDADADGTCSLLLPARLHHEIRNIGETATSMLAFFPTVAPEIFPVR